jgi:hypothetical protein
MHNISKAWVFEFALLLVTAANIGPSRVRPEGIVLGLWNFARSHNKNNLG